MRTTLLAALTLVCLALPNQAQSVLVVDGSGGPGKFASIQAAVDAAVDGDVVLVKPAPSPYLPFTVDGKWLSIAADGGTADVFPPVVVQNVASTQSVTLQGLRIRSVQAAGFFLNIVDCAGPVLVQDCEILAQPSQVTLNIADGIKVTDSSSATFVDVDVDIRVAQGIFFTSQGLVARDSNVFLHGCEVLAGRGSPGDGGSVFPGGPGPPGIDVRGGFCLLVDCEVTGGIGGDGGVAGLFGVCTEAGDGGPALRLLAGADAPEVALVGTTLTPGPGGSAEPGCADGAPSAVDTVIVSGVVTLPPTTGRTFQLTPVVRFGETKTIVFSGEPFDLVFHIFSVFAGSPVYSPALAGTIYPGTPLFVRFRGFLDAAGQKTLSFTLQDTGFPQIPLFEQAIHFGADQKFTASNPRQVLLIDSAIP